MASNSIAYSFLNAQWPGNVIPVREESGKVIPWCVTANDIGDQEKTEERLRNEILILREEIDRSSMFEEIVGSLKPLRQLLKQNVFPIAVPSLRERADDIPLLVQYFVARYSKQYGKCIRHVGKQTLDHLRSYHWPGIFGNCKTWWNVRSSSAKPIISSLMRAG